MAEIGAELVGTGGLLTEPENTGRIVRLSVGRRRRRQGIGCALVAHLLDVARRRDFSRVLVSTEPDWEEAIGLYSFSEKHFESCWIRP